MSDIHSYINQKIIPTIAKEQQLDLRAEFNSNIAPDLCYMTVVVTEMIEFSHSDGVQKVALRYLAIINITNIVKKNAKQLIQAEILKAQNTLYGFFGTKHKQNSPQLESVESK
jgi:hypothetical protein